MLDRFGEEISSRITPMSQRLKLIIAYDGSHFAGWQSQSHRNTIQDHLERAFKKISGDPIRVHGAGRTDAGVHALAQCAHADVSTRKLAPRRWIVALNALLPPSIRILRCQLVSKNFHARFSAKGKLYRYRIWSAPVLPPLEFQRAWHITAPLDLAVMKSAAVEFVGTHDFAGFSANRGHQEKDTGRTIHSIAIRRRGSCVTIDLDADGFLYKMARLIVGALLQCATGRQSVSELAEGFSRNRSHRGRFVAPATGLFLLRVRY
jgi:tRNA pseudouridine38-40 synthase